MSWGMEENTKQDEIGEGGKLEETQQKEQSEGCWMGGGMGQLGDGH